MRATTWSMNEEEQIKKLLAKLKEDEKSVLYTMENVTKALSKKILKSI